MVPPADASAPYIHIRAMQVEGRVDIHRGHLDTVDVGHSGQTEDQAQVGVGSGVHHRVIRHLPAPAAVIREGWRKSKKECDITQTPEGKRFEIVYITDTTSTRHLVPLML